MRKDLTRSVDNLVSWKPLVKESQKVTNLSVELIKLYENSLKLQETFVNVIFT